MPQDPSNGLNGYLSQQHDLSNHLPNQSPGEIEPIAVVGFSLRFPQDATSPETFWRMLTEGRCAMTDFPKDRMNVDAFYHPDSNRYDSVSTQALSKCLSNLLMVSTDTTQRGSLHAGGHRRVRCSILFNITSGSCWHGSTATRTFRDSVQGS